MKEKIRTINDMLRSFGPAAIQEEYLPGRGRVVGYRPQYVLDAINAVLGPTAWRWEIVEEKLYAGKNGGESVVVRLALYFRDQDGSWWKKGEHYGGSHVAMGAYGDAFKAATTDAIQKAFSTLSVARDSYSGALSHGCRHQPKPGPATQPDTQPAVPPAVQPDTVDPTALGLPKSDAMRYVRRHDRIYAEPLTSGASFTLKGLLKGAGFRFDPGLKQWWIDTAMALGNNASH